MSWKLLGLVSELTLFCSLLWIIVTKKPWE
jgi:hypothetical protein